jgi:hypothetical protein
MSDVKKMGFLLFCILLSFFVGMLVGRETGSFDNGYRKGLEHCEMMLEIPSSEIKSKLNQNQTNGISKRD